jgi:RimJ/RimL family protein N-acetyltransferase
MLLEPGERGTTEADEQVLLTSVAARANSVVLLAEDGREQVGYVEACGGEFRRNRHTAAVVIGVRRSHGGRGVGKRLLTELDGWARANGVRRLELTVMTHNEVAAGLYRAMGYEVEGTRRTAVLVDGERVDELWMAKLLSSTPPAQDAPSA